MATPAYRSFGSRKRRTFSEVERHFGVTQGFVQLSGGASVVCVAPPSATDDPADVPAPESVRAFLINPQVMRSSVGPGTLLTAL